METEPVTEEVLPPPKPPKPLWSFAVHPKVALAQPNWRANLLSDFDITTHSVGSFDQFFGRCDKSVANDVARAGSCSVQPASDEDAA